MAPEAAAGHCSAVFCSPGVAQLWDEAERRASASQFVHLQPVRLVQVTNKTPKQLIAPEAAPALHPGDFDELMSWPPSSRLIHRQVGSEDVFNWKLFLQKKAEHGTG